VSALDAQIHREQFQPRPEFRRCACGCGLYSWHDPDYRPLRTEWANWSYSCQIRGEAEILKAQFDAVD
jgi:hypothetical protein